MGRHFENTSTTEMLDLLTISTNYPLSLEKFEVTTSASANFSLQIIQLYRLMIPTSWFSVDDLLLLLDLDIRSIEFSRRQQHAFTSVAATVLM